jgi:hypothetical protein
MLRSRFCYPRLCALLLLFAAACVASCSTEERDFTSSGAAGGGQGGAGGGSGGSGGVNGCGNGALDEGESCDGDCPVECIDPDLCTQNERSGAAETCDVACSFKPRVTCVKNDGCCPAGCHEGIDNDCSMHVLVVAADPNGIPGVKADLESLNVFGLVTAFDAYANPLTAADVKNVDAVLVYTNAKFPDPDALGDVLADFHDGGGRVVLAPGANCLEFGVGGRFLAEGYVMLGFGNPNPNKDALGEIFEPSSPLMLGVQSLTSSTHCDGKPLGDAKVVANFATSGDPIVVRGTVKGRSRVDLNVYPTKNSYEGDVLKLLLNALFYQ